MDSAGPNSHLDQFAAANETISKQKDEIAKQKEEIVRQREEIVKQKEEIAKQKKTIDGAKYKQLMTRSGRWYPFNEHHLSKLMGELEASKTKVKELEDKMEGKDQYLIQLPDTASGPMMKFPQVLLKEFYKCVGQEISPQSDMNDLVKEVSQLGLTKGHNRPRPLLESSNFIGEPSNISQRDKLRSRVTVKSLKNMFTRRKPTDATEGRQMQNASTFGVGANSVKRTLSPDRASDSAGQDDLQARKKPKSGQNYHSKSAVDDGVIRMEYQAPNAMQREVIKPMAETRSEMTKVENKTHKGHVTNIEQKPQSTENSMEQLQEKSMNDTPRYSTENSPSAAAIPLADEEENLEAEFRSFRRYAEECWGLAGPRNVKAKEEIEELKRSLEHEKSLRRTAEMRHKDRRAEFERLEAKFMEEIAQANNRPTNNDGLVTKLQAAYAKICRLESDHRKLKRTNQENLEILQIYRQYKEICFENKVCTTLTR